MRVMVQEIYKLINKDGVTGAFDRLIGWMGWSRGECVK